MGPDHAAGRGLGHRAAAAGAHQQLHRRLHHRLLHRYPLFSNFAACTLSIRDKIFMLNILQRKFTFEICFKENNFESCELNEK